MPPDDGIVNWVEPKHVKYLPDEIEKDVLTVLLKLLICKVKEDHAMMQYKKELRHYAPEICEIVRFAKRNNYQKVDPTGSSYEKIYKKLAGEEEDVPEEEFNADLYSVGDSDGIVEDVDFLEES